MRLLGVLGCALLLAGACGGDDDAAAGDNGANGTATPAADDLSGNITVYAAASLTEAFGEAADQFEEAHPGVRVELNLAASSALREQILAGAPADVFASANTSNMDQVVAADAVEGEPEIFARNELEIVVPAGNEPGVEGLEDFADADLLIGLCAEEVPCGQFGRQALANAGVTPSIDTNEADVRALLTKVQSGDLDAGLVYKTDVLAGGDEVEGVVVPDELNVVADYPIAPLSASASPDVAAAFVAFILSADGQDILASFGFESP
jgi:molybdate transport system substrate-binding protein